MAEPGAERRRILVVEDEWMIAQTLSRHLAEWGYEVVGPAPSVARALALIESAELDGALLDVRLNGETSYRLADELARRSVPFLFLTGFNNQDVEARHRTAPSLTKPVVQSDLKVAMEKLLAERG